jgi:lysophospholipase L1-like esterase
MYLPSDPRLQRIGVRVLGIVLALAAFIAILTFQREQMSRFFFVDFVPFYALRLAALALYLVAIGGITAAVVTSSAPVAIRRTGLLVAAALLCPAVLEGVLMLTPRSNGNGASLAAVVWYRYYWGANNSLDYRDRPVDFVVEAPLRKIVAVGDSFTAGAGVKRRSDRFADRLQTALGPGVRVYNAGLSGSDTQDEYRRLLAFPVKPDAVILQYFGNDIEERASLYDPKAPSSDWPRVAQMLSQPDAQPGAAARVANTVLTGLAGSRLVALCANTLFACNYLAYLAPQPANTPYLEQLLRFYASPAVWSAHEADLRQFVTYSKTRQTPLVVLVFPFLQQPEVSRYYTQKVSAVFRNEGIPAVDLTDDVVRLPLRDRVANSNDPHASPRVHQIAAEHLLPFLRRGQD